VFEKVFNVPYYGLGANKRMKPGVLLQFFQEIAALHANTVNIGVEGLLARGMTWVLRRYRIKIHDLPGKGDVGVRTWFEPQKNLLSVRLFEARDTSGNLIADAWSAWIVVDLRTGRPLRLDRALPDAYFNISEPTGDSVEGKIERIENDFDSVRKFSVRRHELDLNGHTNHTVYFDWAIEGVPDDIADRMSVTLLDAEFLLSAKRENVTARTKKLSDSPVKFAHSVIIDATGAEAARLTTVWE
jgi:acyl-ACP thioesterase